MAAKLAALRERVEDWLSRPAPPERLVSKTLECWAEMRYVGQSFQVDVCLPTEVIERQDVAAMHDAFDGEHERIYSYADGKAAVEFVDLRIRVRGAMSILEPASPKASSGSIACKGVRTMRFQGKIFYKAQIYDRARLIADNALRGPAVMEQPWSCGPASSRASPPMPQSS